MSRILRGLAIVFCLAAAAAGCGYDQVINSWVDQSAGTEIAASPRLPGRVYLLRGLTSVYSFGMDQLADKIDHRGVNAKVYGLTETDTLADEIIRRYKSGEDRGPIMLLGHSSGADRIIAIAQTLNDADVPVALAFGFDPTRGVDPVPANVELFINLYQRFNPIGGGEVAPGPGFRGRLINVDLHQHHEIVHITLDKTPAVQDVVAAKIIAVARHAMARAKARPIKRPGLNADLRPLLLKYTVPGDAPIVLFDDAIKVKVNPGETLDSIASTYGVPAWAITQINAIEVGGSLEPGRMLIVPRNRQTEASPPSAAPLAGARTSVRSGAAPAIAEPLPPSSSQELPAAAGAPASAQPRGRAASSFSDRWRLQSAQ